MSTPAQHVPHHRAMVAVDIEGSTTRTNPARARLRTVLFELLDEAFLAGGITKKHRDAFVDAKELRRQMSITAAPLVLVVSPEMHRSVVRHGYPGIDHDAFAQAAPVRVGTQRLRGWIHTPEAARSQEGMAA